MVVHWKELDGILSLHVTPERLRGLENGIRASINTVESSKCSGAILKMRKWAVLSELSLLEKGRESKSNAFLHICPSQSPRKIHLELRWPFSKKQSAGNKRLHRGR